MKTNNQAKSSSSSSKNRSILSHDEKSSTNAENVKLFDYQRDNSQENEDDQDDDIKENDDAGSVNDDDDDEIQTSTNEDDEHNSFPTLDQSDLHDEPSKKPTKKSGIVYIGNLPPGMKPYFLKSLLMNHGTIKRQYLEPEDDAKRKRRIAAGGSGGLRYTEGWVEFETKREAKDIALQLNGTRIGRRKGSRFYDDLWMIRYLKGFTWQMLVEKSVIQRKEREQRLRLELSKAKKEDEAFLQSVARAKRFKMKQDHEKNGESQPARSEGSERHLPKQFEPIRDKTKRKRDTSD